jgi:hypothetical protein
MKNTKKVASMKHAKRRNTKIHSSNAYRNRSALKTLTCSPLKLKLKT